MPFRAVESTGIKGEGEWHARKHGGAKRRVWRKIHLGTDEETLEVRAVEITGSHVGAAPLLPNLLGQIPADQEIGCVVTADGAYDTCNAIADRGAHAVIPPRKNAKPWKTVTAVQSPETRPCGRRNISAVRSDDDGADTTAGATSKQNLSGSSPETKKLVNLLQK